MGIKKWTALALSLVLVLVAARAFLKTGRGNTTSEPRPKAPVLSAEVEQNKEQKTTSQNRQNSDSRIERLSDGRVMLAHSIARSQELNLSTDSARDLEIISEVFADYFRIFREKPFGSENQEITAQLLGANSKKLVFLDPASPLLSSEGELLDRWTSPYRFHPLTSEFMGVRSLGPDRVLWTNDDLKLDLTEIETQLQLTP